MEFSLVPVQSAPHHTSAREAGLENRPVSVHCFKILSESLRINGFSSTFFTHSSKEKDTPFFAFLLDILHSRQSRRHTSEELERGGDVR